MNNTITIKDIGLLDNFLKLTQHNSDVVFGMDKRSLLNIKRSYINLKEQTQLKKPSPAIFLLSQNSVDKLKDNYLNKENEKTLLELETKKQELLDKIQEYEKLMGVVLPISKEQGMQMNFDDDIYLYQNTEIYETSVDAVLKSNPKPELNNDDEVRKVGAIVYQVDLKDEVNFYTVWASDAEANEKIEKLKQENSSVVAVLVTNEELMQQNQYEGYKNINDVYYLQKERTASSDFERTK